MFQGVAEKYDDYKEKYESLISVCLFCLLLVHNIRTSP